jgi:phenylalanyl-tRNA synthetase alpha chain
LEGKTGRKKAKYVDLTRPAEVIQIGSRHPISIVKNQIIEIFSIIGFNVSGRTEIEDDWHNFYWVLNLPEYHIPQEICRDTLFRQIRIFDKNAHLFGTQVRYMEENKPPIRTISPEVLEMKLFLLITL